MSQTTCKVCGRIYSADQKSCPRCGCLQGATIPAYLRCKRCGTVLPSSQRNCPKCGQPISPQTAGVVLFRDLAGKPSAAASATPLNQGKPKRPSTPISKRQRIWRWIGGIAAALLVLVGETFLVKTIYANVTYRECLELWNCGGSVAANRRAPDPVYEDTVEETTTDSLADIRQAHNTDSLDRAEAIEETETDSLDF